MTDNPVGWFEIYVQDMSRAKKFYETVLQTRFQQLTADGLEMWAFPMNPEAKGCGGALIRAEGVPSGGNSTLVYFTSADCAQEAARVPAAGGKIFRDKFSIGQYGFVALVVDTEGNMFGVHSMK